MMQVSVELDMLTVTGDWLPFHVNCHKTVHVVSVYDDEEDSVRSGL